MTTAAARVYVLHGPEAFRKKEALDQLRASVGIADVVEANTTVLPGKGLTLSQIMNAASAMPFLADRRLVIVEGLLASTEEQQTARPRGRSRAAKGDADPWEGLADALRALPSTTTLVFLDGEVRKTNPLLQVLEPVAEVTAFQPPTGEALHRWIREQIAEAGASITPGAASALVELVGGNLWALHGEVEKLALYADGRAIEEQDVDALVASSREASIFRFVDAVLAGRAGQAMQLLHGLLQGGAELGYILTMISRQLRFVLVAQELQRSGAPQQEFSSRLGLSGDFALRIVLEQSRKYKAEQLENMYGKLVDTDWAVKRGEMEEELALQTLVAELAGTSGATRRGGGR